MIEKDSYDKKNTHIFLPCCRFLLLLSIQAPRKGITVGESALRDLYQTRCLQTSETIIL